MPFTIIVIGKPGSGKSTFVQVLSSKLRTHTDYQIQVFNDRDILVEMAYGLDFRELIRPLDSKNFEVVDVLVYDIAVDRLVSKLREMANNRVLLVEFSRNEYMGTFERFGDLFSDANSVAIYIDTPFDICKKRNIERAISNNSYTVPWDEMESYFRVDDVESLILAYPKQVLVLDNELEPTKLAQQLEAIWPRLQQTIPQRID